MIIEIEFEPIDQVKQTIPFVIQLKAIVNKRKSLFNRPHRKKK